MFEREFAAGLRCFESGDFTVEQSSWYILLMLRSFIGTYDSAGLLSLRFDEGDFETLRRTESNLHRFWVILDTDRLPSIGRAMMLGHRGTALELIVQQAKSLGQIDA
jgi:hypothetical protein